MLPRPAFALKLYFRHLVEEDPELLFTEITASLFQPRGQIGPNFLRSELVRLLEAGRGFGALRRRAHALRGRCTVNVVPSFSDDSTSILPLCAWTI